MRYFATSTFAALLIAAAATTLPAAAQSELFDKAPPDIDGPLRERVTGFYQAHVDGKFRAAEQFVAPGDSQEIFYQMQKQRYESCKTIRITYENGHQEAIVTQSCKGKWNIQGTMLDSEMAMSSTWKRIDGVWFWHLKKPDRTPSPFGSDFVYNTGEKGKPVDPNQPSYQLGTAVPTDMSVAARALMDSVTADKQAIELKSWEPSSDTVVLENKMPGTVKLQVATDGGATGFTASVDKVELRPGEKASLRISMKPTDRSPKPAGSVFVTVDPIGKIIPVKVTFAIAPETEKLLPESMRKPQPAAAKKIGK